MSEEVHILLGMILIIFYKAIGGGSQPYPKILTHDPKINQPAKRRSTADKHGADFLAIGERNVEATMIEARMHFAIGWK
jgi:hypothetical protein